VRWKLLPLARQRRGERRSSARERRRRRGRLFSGTSAASPLVAGVAAMMRAVNPSLDGLTARQMLMDSGWVGTGRVSRGLDARAAVMAALGGTLPKDFNEPNDSPATASVLLPTGPGGSLQPFFGGIATRSNPDADFYRFDVKTFSQVTITLESYTLLGSLSLLLQPDDPDSRALADLVRTSAPSGGTTTTTLTGPLAAGTYRVQVGGTADTAYRLSVRLSAANVPPDQFESNDSFDEAARMIFEPRKGLGGRFGGSVSIRPEYGPGTFDATLHATLSKLTNQVRINPDNFRLDAPAATVFRIPTVTIANADLPLDVSLFDAQRKPIGSWPGVRRVEIRPPAGALSYLVVTGSTVNRYTISTRLKVDRGVIPGPLQEELDLIPKWWGDPPPDRILDRVKHYAVELGADPGDGPSIVFERPEGETGLRVELLDPSGRVVRRSTAAVGAIRLDTTGLDHGPYVVRITRDRAAVASGQPLELRLLPPR
jgi:hypothetical protein